MIALLLAVQQLADLEQTRLSPFPRAVEIAVAAREDVEPPPAAVLEAVGDYYRRVSRGRFLLTWSAARTFPVRPVDGIAIGSAAETELVAPLVAEALRRHRAADAVCLVVPREGAVRGWFRWPHEGTVTIGRRSVPYYVAWPDAGRLETVGIHAHEIGHVAGLEDEYEHQDVDEGVWCVMSRGWYRGEPPGRDPAPPCAPCRLKLGWMPAATLETGRVKFGDADACLRAGDWIIERRVDAFLVWEGGRLVGIPSGEWLVGRGVKARIVEGVLELEKAPRTRRVTIGE